MAQIIFQAQSRMIFGVQGEDADLLAHEVASIKFDAYKIKDEIHSLRQITTGHHRETLYGTSEQRQSKDSWTEASGRASGGSEQRMIDPVTHNAHVTKGRNTSNNKSQTRGGGSAHSSGYTSHEQLVPDLETFRELSSRTYQSFDEQKSEWASCIRNLRTGCALMRLVNDPKLYTVDIKRSAPGFLQYDMHTIARKFPRAVEDMDRLIEENFQSDFFVPASHVDAEAETRIERVLRGQVVISGKLGEGNGNGSPAEESPLM